MNYFLKTTGLSLLCSMMLTTGVKANNPVEYVNPLVGSESTFQLSTGNTYPIIAMPWGMNFWTPQTGKMGDGWTYSYTATKIRGLKQTHQPSPWINDYGCFALMPITGAPVFDETKRASWFSHKAETAKPYYYSVYLADYDVTAEVVPTERAALFRLTFPKSDSSFVVIDAYDRGSSVTILPEQRKIIGYTTRNSGLHLHLRRERRPSRQPRHHGHLQPCRCHRGLQHPARREGPREGSLIIHQPRTGRAQPQ